MGLETLNTMNVSQVEPFVRAYAAKVFQRNNIRSSLVEVHLSLDMDAIMATNGGSPVNLYLKWPQALPQLNTLLGDFCRAYKKFNLYRTMEVVPYAYTRTVSDENKRKWRKELFTDESEIVLDLIPKHRLRVYHSETVTVEDSLTGEKLAMTHSFPVARFEGQAIGLWMQLSRIVRAKYSTPEDNQNNNQEQEKETVELDKYLANRMDT